MFVIPAEGDGVLRAADNFHDMSKRAALFLLLHYFMSIASVICLTFQKVIAKTMKQQKQPKQLLHYLMTIAS